MVSVLMVCMGNICRSPMAEGVFKARVDAAGLSDLITTDSAGTIGYHAGNPPDTRGMATMQARGHDISAQRSRKVRDSDFTEFDYIIAMDEDNFYDLLARCPDDMKDKISLFLNYGSRDDGTEVPDPYYGGGDGFTLVYDLVDDAAQGLLSAIRAKHF